MAEQEGILRFIRGLFKDTSHIDQPMGTYRYAKNLILSDTTGALSNEPGTESVANLPNNSVVIGAIATTNNRIVLFIKYGAVSEVGVYDGNSYESVLSLSPISNTDSDLKFNEKYPISGTFKEQADGDLVVYWTDDFNPPRALNVTRQQRGSTSLLYNIAPNSSPDTKLINLLNLFPHAGPVPHVELLDVHSGGGCKTGVYYLALAYTDEDLTETNYVTIANPVSIVEEPEGIAPIESYDGAEPETMTGKSITWDISNLNTDMDYLTVQVIQIINGARTVVRLGNFEITDSTKPITYSGEESQTSSSDDIVLVEDVEYSKAKCIEQLDSQLYLGNLESALDLGYQKYANFIKSSPCTKRFNAFDPFEITDSYLTNNIPLSSNNDRSQGYRDPKNIFKYKGYQRDEVYAFYIAFILKSGKMSYAYHIPGRKPLENVNKNDINELIGDENENSPTFVNEGQTLLGNGNGNVGDWDIIDFTGTTNSQGYLYQWYDFSSLANSRGMNYWKNLHEFYPNTENFQTVDASTPNVPITSSDNRGENVRHHRFPGNKNANYTTVVNDPEDTSIADRFNNLSSKRKLTVRWYWFGAFEGEGTGWGLAGKYSSEDFYEARGFQQDVTIGGHGMGGYHPSGSDVDRALNPQDDIDRATSCLPEKNTTFQQVILGQVSNNNPSNSVPDRARGLSTEALISCDVRDVEWEDVDFVYDATTVLTYGQPIFIAYDRPSANGDTVGCKEPHCSGMGQGTISSDDGQQARFASTHWQYRCNGILPRTDEPLNDNWSRPGWVAWVECSDKLEDDSSNVLEQEVQALGICFEDIKIPKTIADQIQGFRIYHADRTHENRTIVGQCPIHPMDIRTDMDTSGCDGGGVNRGLIDYYLPAGQPIRRNIDWGVYELSFNDFYLLNKRPSLAQATHLRFQYTLCFANFAGHADFYGDPESAFYTDEEREIYSCLKPDVITSFHLSGEHFIIQGNSIRLNYLLEGKAKKYVNGGTIYDGTADNFGKKIYTIGGHSTIVLKTKRHIPYLASNNTVDEGWRRRRGDGSGVAFESYTRNTFDPGAAENGLQLHMANLHAFKSDVYNKTDKQGLVWTGFEVLGEKIKEFIVDENGSKIVTANPDFSTGEIFGGDTYICRYGYRMTHREEVNHDNVYPNTGSIDRKSVIMTIVETSDNINFRNIKVDEEPYFPGASLKAVLKIPANTDLSYNADPDTGKMRYNEDYSLVNNLKNIVPLPWVFEQQEKYPVRVIRSSTASSSALIDNYRQYISSAYRELNNRYGELWKITATSNLLLFHMEDALYKTKGKQKMKVSEGGNAFVGSGDIFEQLPDLVKHVDSGYIGTRSQFAALACPSGYFFIDNIDRKIFLVAGQGVEELSSSKYGMSNWLQKNIPYELEEHGFHGKIDSFITGMGFLAVWDDMFKRILLTKRDLRPTAEFTVNYKGIFKDERGLLLESAGSIGYINGTYFEVVQREGILTTSPLEIDINTSLTNSREPLFERTGWTISFSFIQIQQGKIGSWESFHDYVPYMYSYAGIDVHSFNDSSNSIWKHNDYENISKFYGEQYSFEVEIISNMMATKDKVFVAFNILSEVKDRVNGDFLINDLNAGFTEYITYGNDSSSGLRNIQYLINTRKIGSEWRINQFRDMSLEITDTSQYYIGPIGGFSGTNYLNPGQTILGGINPGTITSVSQSIFNVDGMNETVNTLFTDPNKPWHLQRKFIGKYLGIRLVSDNAENKLINLYSVLSDFRPYMR
jgi:hypothetical protein